jgi:hypothetical protein
VGIWRRVEKKLWTGEVVKDYGIISDGKYQGSTRRVSVLLAGKGTRLVFIRVSYRAWFGGSVSFLEFDRDAASKLQAALADAVRLM